MQPNIPVGLFDKPTVIDPLYFPSDSNRSFQFTNWKSFNFNPINTHPYHYPKPLATNLSRIITSTSVVSQASEISIHFALWSVNYPNPEARKGRQIRWRPIFLISTDMLTVGSSQSSGNCNTFGNDRRQNLLSIIQLVQPESHERCSKTFWNEFSSRKCVQATFYILLNMVPFLIDCASLIW